MLSPLQSFIDKTNDMDGIEFSVPFLSSESGPSSLFHHIYHVSRKITEYLSFTHMNEVIKVRR